MEPTVLVLAIAVFWLASAIGIFILAAARGSAIDEAGFIVLYTLMGPLCWLVLLGSYVHYRTPLVYYVVLLWRRLRG